MLVFNGALHLPNEGTITPLAQKSQIIAFLLKNTSACEVAVGGTYAVRNVDGLCDHGEVLRAASVFLVNQLHQLATNLERLFGMVNHALHTSTFVKKLVDLLSSGIAFLDFVGRKRAEHAGA